jgi:hypothetical protein
MTPTNNTLPTQPDAQQPTDKGLDGTTCSAFNLWWNDQENGCPTLVLNNDEQFAQAVWNAAIKAANSATWEKQDKWGEGNGYSPTKAAAAEEIGCAIRRLFVPNTPAQPPKVG